MIAAEGYWAIPGPDNTNRIPVNIKIIPQDGGGRFFLNGAKTTFKEDFLELEVNLIYMQDTINGELAYAGILKNNYLSNFHRIDPNCKVIVDNNGVSSISYSIIYTKEIDNSLEDFLIKSLQLFYQVIKFLGIDKSKAEVFTFKSANMDKAKIAVKS